MPNFYIIDGNSYIHRAYHAMPPLTTSKGEMVNAVYGFLKMLLNVVKNKKPDYLVVCFDHPSPTFRHKEYPLYKAHRKEIDDELKNQMPLAREAVKALNIVYVETPGFEADDLIATLAKQAEAEGTDVFIVTSDKDALQMVGGNIKVWNEGKDIIYGRDAVKEKYGLFPEQLTDMFALMGDSSDNVPGVKGIGEKTAVKLIQQFGSLSVIFENAGDITGKTGELIRNGKEAAEKSKKLVVLDTGVPMPINWKDCKMKPPDEAELTDFLKRMEFKSLLTELIPANEARDNATRFDVKVKTVLSLNELKGIVELAKSKGYISIDTETTSVNPLEAMLVGISAAFDEHGAYYIPLGHSYLGMPEQIELNIAIEALRPVLENNNIKKYGQNLKYDMLVLKRCGIEVKGVYFDTMIASYCLNPSLNSHGLKSIILNNFGFRMTEIEELIGKGAKQTTMDKIEIEKATDYAGADAAAVLLAAAKFKNELKTKGIEKLFYDIEMPLVDVLTQMEYRGIKADIPYVRELSSQFNSEMKKIEAALYRIAGEEFNPNSPKQLAVILFEKLKLPVIRKTKTGYSTDEDTLQELSAQHELPAKVLEYRELQKLKSTYLDSLLELADTDGRVHTSFNQAVTATGRLSSSAPNLQNIPVKSDHGKLIRKCFIAEKGFTLLSSDYSQIDLRALAHITGDEALKKAFYGELDIHTATAKEVFGVDEKDVTPELRRIAKTINFGIIYGMSAFSLSQQLNIPAQKAKEYIENYFARYSGVRKWMEDIIKYARVNGFVTTVTGRIRYLPDINAKNGQIRGFSERMALNTPIQGTSADIIKIAMIDIDKYLKEPGSKTRMLLQVHDELLFEVPDNEMSAVAPRMKQLMENAMKLDVPIVVEMKAGANWNEMSKIKI